MGLFSWLFKRGTDTDETGGKLDAEKDASDENSEMFGKLKARLKWAGPSGDAASVNQILYGEWLKCDKCKHSFTAVQCVATSQGTITAICPRCRHLLFSSRTGELSVVIKRGDGCRPAQ